MSDIASALNGLWQMVAAELEGEAAPDEMTGQTTVELRDGTYAVRFGREVVDSGTFEIGGAVEARTMVLHGQNGPNAGRTIPCLYQIRGDRLRVCYGLDGMAPTEFMTAASDRRYLALYRRTPDAAA